MRIFPRRLWLVAALDLVLGGCAPTSIMRDGVEVPYEQAASEDLDRARRLVAGRW